jgi:hypothetical protein
MRPVSAKTKKIISYMQANPNVKVREIAKMFKIAPTSIYAIRAKLKSAATKGNWKTVAVGTSKKSLVARYTQKPSTLVPNAVASMALYADDMVNHPPHYKTGGIETIDFIEAKNLGYNLGNVVKYISRADYKGDRLENLKKAQWYMNREIDLASKK